MSLPGNLTVGTVWTSKGLQQHNLFFFSAFPAMPLGFTNFGEIFTYVTVFVCFFSNPTIEVVTFCLCGWYMLGVLLFPAFIRLGHECQDLLSPCNGMHVHTD